MKLKRFIPLGLILLITFAYLFYVQNQPPAATSKLPQTSAPPGTPVPMDTGTPAIEAATLPERLVKVGGTDELDACGSAGKVTDLDPQGDNFLAVRAAPNASAQEKDRLNTGATIYMCESVKGGTWIGIVYEPGGSLGAGCGVASPIGDRQDYAGTCRSGWVAGKYIQLVAG